MGDPLSEAPITRRRSARSGGAKVQAVPGPAAFHPSRRRRSTRPSTLGAARPRVSVLIGGSMTVRSLPSGRIVVNDQVPCPVEPMVQTCVRVRRPTGAAAAFGREERTLIGPVRVDGEVVLYLVRARRWNRIRPGGTSADGTVTLGIGEGSAVGEGEASPVGGAPERAGLDPGRPRPTCSAAARASRGFRRPVMA